MAQFPIPHLRRQPLAPRCHRDSPHRMIVIRVWATFLSAECRSFDCCWRTPLNRHLRLGSATVASDNSDSHLETYTMTSCVSAIRINPKTPKGRHSRSSMPSPGCSRRNLGNATAMDYDLTVTNDQDQAR